MHFIITLIAALIVGLYTYKKKVPVNAKTLLLTMAFVIMLLALSDFCAGILEGLQD
ncbi:hypothetical protein RM577_09695 [Mammaliicoccus sciuri]|uniref:hypothetical protein n=1 Tax=Mammaliicoccus sciuri TaxID=1296 RepID=UPI001E419C6C|nr:hypothetical protein [Mammaliicoccus sciuri]MCD8881542.1 hypothetical protein [Mammaliicoccus sciuri]MDT0708578.1 hypothetical protein [Mammaliicoccus sciuri]MEB7783608.1 hypothetical protein [Mammaliicoccus sciuri]